MALAVINHLLSSGEFVAIALVAPRSDDLQVRCERGGGQFETHLIVALAGGAVGDGIRFFLLRDFHHALGDERSRDACTEEVLALVNRAGVNHRINEVGSEFFLKVIDVNLRCAGVLRFLFEAVKFLFLPDVGAEGDHLGVVFFFDPREQHRSVETARVSQHNFHIEKIRRASFRKCARRKAESAMQMSFASNGAEWSDACTNCPDTYENWNTSRLGFCGFRCGGLQLLRRLRAWPSRCGSLGCPSDGGGVHDRRASDHATDGTCTATQSRAGQIRYRRSSNRRY